MASNLLELIEAHKKSHKAIANRSMGQMKSYGNIIGTLN